MILVAVHEPAAAPVLPWSAFDTVVQETRILGSFYGSADVARDIPRLITLVEAGRLDVGSMVSRRLTLDQVNEGLTAMEKGEVIRSVIVGS